MKSRFLTLAVLLAASLATGAQAGVRSASIGVSATVSASCRIELPSHVEARAAAVPNARLTCPHSSRPATRAVIERGTPDQPRPVRTQAVAMNADAGASEIQWVRYDVEY